MSTSLSVFLNIIRLFCALVITLGHLSGAGFMPDVPFDGSWSHFAVIVFFVISGYCIGYSRHKRHNTLADYAVARLSRIYSILFPALIVTAILYFLGSFINPGFYSHWGNNTQPWSMVLTFFSVQELWFGMSVPLSNSALWMLSYLVGFYALYGLMTYLRGALRIFWVGLLCLWLGPKVMLLLPCWLVGLMVYHIQPHIKWGRSTAAAILIMSLTLLLGFSTFVAPHPGAFGMGELHYSSAFTTDIIQSFFIAFALLALKEIFVTFSDKASELAKRSASITFSLFAISQPLFIFLGALIPEGYKLSPWVASAVSAVVLVSAVVFSNFEKTRQLWAKLFSKLFNPPAKG